MPMWLSLLLPMVLRMIAKYGVPVLEQKFPWLKPIVDEILLILAGSSNPSPKLESAAKHYNFLSSGVGVPPSTLQP